MFFTKSGQYRIYLISWIPLLVSAVLLAICCFVVGRWTANKNYDDTQIKAKISSLEQEIISIKEINRIEIKNQNVYLQKSIEEIKNSKDYEARDRLILVACLLNENFAAIQAKKPQDFIFVERNWRINRMPKYLDMNHNDMEWLMQFIDKDTALLRQLPDSPKMPNH